VPLFAAAVVAAAVGVELFVGATVAALVAAAVAALVAAALVDAPDVAFFVATGFAAFVATVVPEAIEDDDDADALVPVPVELATAPPAIFKSPELNCGGVIAKTAPRPPTVPPAINNARFISYPHFVIAPREDQHLYINPST
jgi:hypothetical protein